MKYITSIWSTLILVALMVGIRIWDPAFVEQIRLNTFDQYIKLLPQEKSNDIVLINISEESLEQRGQFPWPRQEYAQMISDLRNKNAGYIGFTIMFPEPDRFGGDEVFASWIKDNGILLTQTADEYGRSDSAPYVGYATFGTGEPLDFIYKYKGIVTNIKPLEEMAWGVGISNAAPEVDSITRRVPLITNINEQLYPSFALEMTRLVYDQLSYTIKSNEAGIESVVVRPFEVPTDSDGSIWLKWNTEFEEHDYIDNLSAVDNLQGKAVIIGVTARGLSQQLSTPNGLMYPHQLQANALHTIFSDNPISRPQYATPIEVLSGLVLALLLVLLVYRAPVWVSGIGFLVFCFGQVGLTYYIWNKFYILLDLSFQLILYIISFTSSSFNNFYKQFMLRQQIKKQFETYLDPKQVAILQKNPDMLKLGGERKDMTFMFMDIIGFTPVSEHYKNKDDPEGLVNLINRYLDRMTKIIIENGGTIDKYMGDCIMAFWNAPLDEENHAEKAIQAGMAISLAAEEFKKELENEGLPSIDIGIGINTGTCIVGNMGSETRFDYSVIGDAVNLASRLEGQTRNYDGVRMLLSQATVKECKGRPGGLFKKVDDIKVKGKSESIAIYTLYT